MNLSPPVVPATLRGTDLSRRESNVTDYQAEAGDMASAGAKGADLGIRFAARLIDHVLLAIVVSFLLIPLVIGAMFDDVGLNSAFGTTFGAGALVASIISAAIVIGYFAFMESSRGQTIGKMLLKLRTQGPDGANPSLEEAVKRNLFYALGIVPFLGGIAQLAAVIFIAVTINNSALHQGWHDDFAGGTKVVRTE